MPWLIQQEALDAMASAPAFTEEQIAQMSSDIVAQGGPDPRGNADNVMTVVGGTAQINVVGVMTSSRDFLARMFGGGNVLYGDLVAAIRSAEQDPAVERVEFYIDSPGGEAQPVIGLGDLIAGMNKPTKALVVNAHSAAYWVAAQADQVIANTRASTVGSIGAVTRRVKPSESFAVNVTSTNAPNKRPDPETDQGKQVIREYELDPLHDMFVQAVATGRSTTVENVNANFGRGASMFADKALAVGMIDEIVDMPAQSTAPSDDGQPTQTKTKTGAKTMDLETLKAEHPGVYAQVLKLGRDEGIDEERNRVKYHATMGERMGAQAYALKACADGVSVADGEAQAEYLSAGVNKQELASRQQEETELSSNTPAPSGEEAKKKKQVSSIFSHAGFAVKV